MTIRERWQRFWNPVPAGLTRDKDGTLHNKPPSFTYSFPEGTVFQGTGGSGGSAPSKAKKRKPKANTLRDVTNWWLDESVHVLNQNIHLSQPCSLDELVAAKRALRGVVASKEFGQLVRALVKEYAK